MIWGYPNFRKPHIVDTRYFVMLDPQEDVLRVFSERAISMALKKEQLAAWQASGP